MNWKGAYTGGGLVVTAKHWWSPKERRAARIAAQLSEAQNYGRQVELLHRDRLLYGAAYMDQYGNRIDPERILAPSEDRA